MHRGKKAGIIVPLVERETKSKLFVTYVRDWFGLDYYTNYMAPYPILAIIYVLGLIAIFNEDLRNYVISTPAFLYFVNPGWLVVAGVLMLIRLRWRRGAIKNHLTNVKTAYKIAAVTLFMWYEWLAVGLGLSFGLIAFFEALIPIVWLRALLLIFAFIIPNIFSIIGRSYIGESQIAEAIRNMPMTKLTAYATLALAAVTTGMVIVSALQYGVQTATLEHTKQQVAALNNQTAALNNQVTALRDQVRIASQQFNSTIRPWIGVKDVRIYSVTCLPERPFLQPLYGKDLDPSGENTVPKNMSLYVSTNDCSSLKFVYDVTITNSGNIPAHPITIQYLISDKELNPKGNYLTSKNTLSSNGTITEHRLNLMPQQEIMIQISSTARLEDFPYLHKKSNSTIFDKPPDLLLVELNYEFEYQRHDAVGFVHKIGDGSHLIMVDSWRSSK